MRLIADFNTEREMYGFHAFLLKEGIQNTFEAYKDPKTKEVRYHVWITEEDDFDKALAWYQELKKNPSDIRFTPKRDDVFIPQPPPVPPQATQKWKVKVEIPKRGPRFSLTNLLIVVCGVLFFWMGVQETKVGEKIPPIQQELLFDYPQYLADFDAFLKMYPVKSLEDIKKLPPEAQACFQKIQEAPTWKGVSELIVTRSLKDWDQIPPGTLFGKIRQGQVWRIFTPTLLHGNLLHILFNMAWLWVLGRQMEERMGKLKLALFVLITGSVANIFQYIISGPVFLGFSGVIVGMVGFIWMRQKIAPWEGYPLHRSIYLFILIFVLAMLALEIASMAAQFFRVTELSANMANTAHIVGGLVGILLARFPFFVRSMK